MPDTGVPAAGADPAVLVAHTPTPLVLRAAWFSLGMLDLPGGSLAAELIARHLLPRGDCMRAIYGRIGSKFCLAFP